MPVERRIIRATSIVLKSDWGRTMIACGGEKHASEPDSKLCVRHSGDRAGFLGPEFVHPLQRLDHTTKGTSPQFQPATNSPMASTEYQDHDSHVSRRWCVLHSPFNHVSSAANKHEAALKIKNACHAKTHVAIP